MKSVGIVNGRSSFEISLLALSKMSTQNERAITRKEYIDLLDLPKDSSLRLCMLKMAQFELETKQRKDNEHLIPKLEEILKQEQDRYILLKQSKDKDLKEKPAKLKAIKKYRLNTDFYEEKLDKLRPDVDKMEKDLKSLIEEVSAKAEEYKRLNKALEEFEGLEPTNEALKSKIDEMKKSRLSLEMTFVDEGGDNNSTISM